MSTSPKTPKKVAGPKALAAPKVRKQKPASGSARRPKAASAADSLAARPDAVCSPVASRTARRSRTRWRFVAVTS